MKCVHVTIRTGAFEEEVRFFERFAGLAVVRDLRPQGMPIVFLADGPGDTMIEIIDRPEAEPIRGGSLSIGFHAEDLDAVHALLKEEGFCPSEFSTPGPGVRFFYVDAPSSTRVQFI